MAGGGGRLGGTGPWNLVDLADGLGLSYDTVCRDVRRGVLPARPVAHPRQGRYEVALDDLERAGRSVYREAAGALRAALVKDRPAG